MTSSASLLTPPEGPPVGWRRVRLGEVCQIVARQVDPRLPEFAALPHVSGENIESKTRRLLPVQTAGQDGMTSGKYLFDAGDVLYSKLRPYLRKVAVAPFAGVCSADMYPLRTDARQADAQYISWLLLSDRFTAYADRESRRARMPKLNREQLFAWETDLPPLPEQLRISALLDAQMAIVERTRVAAGSARKAAASLEHACLRQAFPGGRPLTGESTERVLPPGWRWAHLGDLARYVNGRAFKPSEWSATGAPIIRIQNLTSSEVPFNFFPGRTDEGHRVADGDLLVSWSASLDAFIWTRGPAVLNQHIFKVNEFPDRADRQFLYYALRNAMAEIRGQVHGATMRHITKPEFERVRIAVPGLSEQRRIAVALRAQVECTAKLLAALDAQLSSIDTGATALLRSAFPGEL